MKIAIGCDSAGFILKQPILEYLTQNDIQFEDIGVFEEVSCDYTDYAREVAEKVAKGECDRGILLCGTGIGMSIAANKVPGVRAALCHDEFTARATTEHNDTNVLCMGGRLIAPYMGVLILDSWLKAEFQGGRHQARIDKITDIEKKYCK